MALDRKALLEALEVPVEEVEIPGLGTLLVRGLSQAEDAHVRKLAASDDVTVRLSGVPYIVSRAVMNVDRTRMFTDAEAEKIANGDPETASAIALAIRKVSKLTPEAAKEEGESSAATSQPASS